MNRLKMWFDSPRGYKKSHEFFMAFGFENGDFQAVRNLLVRVGGRKVYADFRLSLGCFSVFLGSFPLQFGTLYHVKSSNLVHFLF